MTRIGISAFRGSADSFTAALAENNIPYHELDRLSDRPETGGMALEVVPNGCGLQQIAEVLVAWLDASKNRRVNLVTKYGTVIWIEDYSADDVAMVLESTTHIAVIDTKPTDVAG